jgi:hypothetical protein
MFAKIGLTALVIVATIVAGLIVMTTAAKLTEPIMPIGGKNLFDGLWDKGTVSATGTWTMLNDRPADPIQVTQLRCYRETGLCFEASAKYSLGKYISAEFFPRVIESWTKDVITYSESSALCVVIHYTISRNSNQVTGRRVAIKPTPQGCEGMRQTDVDLAMVDGFEVWRTERDRAMPWTLIGALEALLVVGGICLIAWIWWPKQRGPVVPA